MLSVCNLSRSTRESGRVLIPVESAISNRRLRSSARKTGRTRRGFDAMFSSSRFSQTESTGGRAPRKLAEISRASNVVAIRGRVFVKNAGMALGVDDEPRRRCVVPKECDTFQARWCINEHEHTYLAGHATERWAWCLLVRSIHVLRRRRPRRTSALLHDRLSHCHLRQFHFHRPSRPR